MSNVSGQPQPPQDPHPVVVKQEAERVISVSVRWRAGRFFAFALLVVGSIIGFSGNVNLAGLLLLWSGIGLIFASLDLHTYNRALKRFTEKYSIGPKEWLEQHARP
jgi:hypothetical protein